MRDKKIVKGMVCLFLCFVLVMVTGCGKNTAPTNNTSNATSAPEEPKEVATAKPEKKIEMVWAGWSGEEEASKPIIQSMVASWNDQNPNATVKWLGWPWANTLEQLMVRSFGKEQLDVAQADQGWTMQLASSGAVEDLNTLFDAKWLADNFEQSALNVAKIDGKQIGLPWTLASIGMVFNPSLLEKAGISGPLTTIADFEAALQKLKDSDPNMIPYAMDTKTAGGLVADFTAWLWTYGGRIFDKDKNVTINNDQGVQTLTWLKSLKEKGYIKMDVGRGDSRQLFAKNLVGFYDDAILAKGILEGNGIAKDQLDKMIKPMLKPVLKQGDVPKSVMWGHTLVVFKASENKEKAVEFIKHIISDSQSIPYFEKIGMLPVMKSGLENEKVKSSEWANNWSAITKTGQPGETRDFKQIAEINTIIAEEIQAALLNAKSPKQALDDAAAKILLAIK